MLALFYDRLASGAIDFTQWFGVPFSSRRSIRVESGGVPGRRPRGLFRALRRTPRDQHGLATSRARPWRCRPRSPQTSILADDGSLRRSRPPQGHRWVQHSPAESIQLLAEGKIDASWRFRRPQELRANKIGHVVVNTTDRPALVAVLLLHDGRATASSSEAPVATKRVLRAFLKARSSVRASPSGCAAPSSTGDTRAIRLRPPDPEGLPSAGGASIDPEDTVRFYALRLQRGRDDQVEPAEDHRAGHGLAVPQRAQEGAEGMITRRDLLRGVAGTVGLLGWPPGHASGGAAAGDDEAQDRPAARASAWLLSTSSRSS